MAYQDMFGMWYDTQDQANKANYTATNTGFNAAPASWADTAHSLTNSGTGIAGNILTPEQAAALQNSSYSSFSPGASQGGYGGGSGGSGGGGGYGQSSSSGSMSMTGQNPYLKQMGDVMVGQMTDNFNRSVVPAIGSAAMASGGYGGSRQGVMEANANNDLQRQIAGGLTNLYGGGFNTALNYDLGLRGNDLGFAGLDAQINQNNFNNRLNGANFGLGLWNQGMANNQTGINAGTNIQNTPMNYWSQFGNQYNSIGQGFGTTTGSASQQGNPMMGMLGGAQLGSQIGNWWGGGRAGSAADTAAGNNFWAPNFSGSMGD